MLQEEEAVTVSADIQKPNIPLVPILICAALSVLFMNTGILSFFYLVPLGYAIILSGSFLHTFAVAAAAGIGFKLIKFTAGSGSSALMLLDIMYFSVIIFCFTWIMGGKRFRTAYRFILASAAGTVFSLIFINSPQVKFFEYFREIAEGVFNNSSVLSGENDHYEKSTGLLGIQNISPEQMVEMARSLILRGGALVSVFFLFFINRQIANVIYSIVKRQRRDLSLISFIAPVNAIWVLSGALATILLTNAFKIEIIGILAWNVLTICLIVFLAQGAGVLMYWMSLRANVFRLVINVLIVVILLSPISIFAVAALVILGVADIWVSFRSPKQDAVI